MRPSAHAYSRNRAAELRGDTLIRVSAQKAALTLQLPTPRIVEPAVPKENYY
jgi:hypothetical protein